MVLKFLLHVSRAEQAERLRARLEEPDKNWKYDAGDLDDRARWDAYTAAYRDVLRETACAHAPWYVVPADRKWFTRVTVANIINQRLSRLDLHYPKLSEEQYEQLHKAKQILEAEK